MAAGVADGVTQGSGDRVGAVVVFFQPGIEAIRNVERLVGEVERVVVVDNGSDESTRQGMTQWSRQPEISVIRNRDNRGVAAALNQGVRLIVEAGCDWVLTLDQDSQVAPGMVATMLSDYRHTSRKNSIGLLHPCYQDVETGRTLCHDDSSGRIITAITSGSLIRREVFDRVGEFDEKMFVDYVDHEFCLRSLRAGFSISQVADAILRHRLGTPTVHYLFGRRIVTTNHSVIRRYYVARNRIYVYLKYFSSFPMWVLRDLRQFVREIIVILMFERGKAKKMRAVAVGMLDGVLGRMGAASRVFHEDA